jgi:hypothetical protein
MMRVANVPSDMVIEETPPVPTICRPELKLSRTAWNGRSDLQPFELSQQSADLGAVFGKLLLAVRNMVSR